ncbi:MAG: hypothetical protein JXD18_11600 [Anaerolineae bacterium]|nr:hypothetical protein [Anaerolineae bacterium]
MRRNARLYIVAVLGGGALLMLALAMPAAGDRPAQPSAPLTIVFTPTAYYYLPLVERQPTPTPTPVCPPTSTNVYVGGYAFQFDKDNPVRPAYNHADKNIELRSYAPLTDSSQQPVLVDYGPPGDETQPPQFATLFAPYRVPTFSTLYRVYNWNWAPSPDPGTRGALMTYPVVTALGMATTRWEPLYVPVSGYDIGSGIEVIVLYADDDTLALRYTREDSSGAPGYTVHIDNICTDPNLLALYNQLDDPAGPRYVYPNPSYDLPNLPAGQPLGVARNTEIVVAIVDTGAFLDSRSMNDWWQIRPGY